MAPESLLDWLDALFGVVHEVDRLQKRSRQHSSDEMSRRSLLIAIVVGPSLCGLRVRLPACCMVPSTWRGTISQSAQEAFVIHDRGREELVLRTNYTIHTSKDAGGRPASFAWVITVSAEPDAYSLADKEFFQEVFDYAGKRLKSPARGKSLCVPPEWNGPGPVFMSTRSDSSETRQYTGRATGDKSSAWSMATVPQAVRGTELWDDIDP